MTPRIPSQQLRFRASLKTGNTDKYAQYFLGHLQSVKSKTVYLSPVSHGALPQPFHHSFLFPQAAENKVRLEPSHPNCPLLSCHLSGSEQQNICSTSGCIHSNAEKETMGFNPCDSNKQLELFLQHHLQSQSLAELEQSKHSGPWKTVG